MYETFRDRLTGKERKAFAKNEKNRFVLKSIQRLVDLPRFVRMENTSLLDKVKRNSSSVRIKNRCLITDRQRGMISKQKLSRLQFRRMSRTGVLNGLRQSSW